MAVPAITTYEVTVELLVERHFPTGIVEDRGTTLAQESIDEAASEVELWVRYAGVEPSKVTKGHSPLAFRWLQTLILVGAALKLLTRLPGGADPVHLREEWQEGLRTLRQEADVVLGDVVRETSGGSRGIFNPV